MVGHAAHRHRHSFFLVARGERDLQFFGRQHRVLKEQLVKIAQPEKQQGLGMLALDGRILPHQRGCRPVCQLQTQRLTWAFIFVTSTPLSSTPLTSAALPSTALILTALTSIAVPSTPA